MRFENIIDTMIIWMTFSVLWNLFWNSAGSYNQCRKETDPTYIGLPKDFHFTCGYIWGSYFAVGPFETVHDHFSRKTVTQSFGIPRHTTTLKLNDAIFNRIWVNLKIHHSTSKSFYVGSASFRHWFQKRNGLDLDYNQDFSIAQRCLKNSVKAETEKNLNFLTFCTHETKSRDVSILHRIWLWIT